MDFFRDLAKKAEAANGAFCMQTTHVRPTSASVVLQNPRYSKQAYDTRVSLARSTAQHAQQGTTLLVQQHLEHGLHS